MSTETTPANVGSNDGLGVNAKTLLPHEYLLAKLAMVMPFFQEARDALTALQEDQRVRHGISKTLADRMDIAGTFSLEDWKRHFPGSAGDAAAPAPVGCGYPYCGGNSLECKTCFQSR